MRSPVSAGVTRDGPEATGGAAPTGVEALPSRLDTAQQKLVYLYLATVPGATTRELKRALGLNLLTVYPVLEALCDRGLVEADGSTYRCRT